MIIPAVDCEAMGTTGLVDYVRGPHWPCVVESTCFSARMARAKEIIDRRCGTLAIALFEKAVYAGRDQPHPLKD